VGALSALLFYACIIAVLFAAPIGLSALIVGFIKKIAHYEHVDEMIFDARALAITIIAVIIIIFIMWFLLTCGFS
jgi:hypothetical protein